MPHKNSFGLQLIKLETLTRGMLHQGCYDILILLMPILPKIASKDGYDYRELDCFRRNDELHVYDPEMLTNVEVEGMLRHIKSTASGCDSIPAWLLRSCSYELADIVTYILNLSFSTGKVPTFWLNALVTPVPKVSKPTGFSDFRPIAVTPHLSRLAEKIIVHRWL